MTTAWLNGLYQPGFVSKSRQHFPVGTVPPGMDPSGREVTIRDARVLQEAEAISEAEFFSSHSFVLLPHASAARDWDRDSAVYRQEVDQVIRERLFPGRTVEIEEGAPILRRGRDTLTPDYADGVHSDGGLGLEDYVHNIAAFADEKAARWWRALYGRSDVAGVVWIDFWRTTNMRGPLQHMPLALCDSASLDPCDLVPLAMTGIAPEGRQSHHLSLRFGASQRWYYYPKMTVDELLVFKLAEFWKAKTPFRNCFHSAFDDPEMPAAAERRQSCEYRVSVLLLND